MSDIETGGPAFPVTLLEGQTLGDGTANGMTLRDHFAGLAMQALIAKHGAYCDDVTEQGAVGSENVFHTYGVAEYAYEQADAMLAERDATK